jgi:hypothetical protein
MLRAAALSGIPHAGHDLEAKQLRHCSIDDTYILDCFLGGVGGTQISANFSISFRSLSLYISNSTSARLILVHSRVWCQPS